MRAGALTLLALLPAFAWSQPTPSGTTGSGTLVESVSGTIEARTIEQLLVDNAAGQVSAASLVGIDLDALAVVENVRDFSMLVNAFDKEGKGFGLSITPARTSFPFPSINLARYAEQGAYLERLLGALTLSYAQGTSDVDGRSYRRRAVSIGTSAFFSPDDDPIVAVARAGDCKAAARDVVSDRPTTTQADADRLRRVDLLRRRAGAGNAEAQREIARLRERAAAGEAEATADVRVLDELVAGAGDDEPTKRRRKAVRESAAVEKASLDAFNACADAVLARHAQKWNRSRYSLSFGTGAIKVDDSGGYRNLGRTYAVSALYGFDHVGVLADRAALSFTARRNDGEPVLETLGTDDLRRKSSTLLAARLSGGSSSFRGLVEFSRLKNAEATTASRLFRRAVGLDLRVTDGLWLNVRYGKQKKLAGSGDETGSFVLLNYSPSALLGR